MLGVKGGKECASLVEFATFRSIYNHKMMASTEMKTDKDDHQEEELSCGFCLQKFMYMENPQCLPCGHVFCLPCLEGDLETLNTVQCGFCG